MLATRKAAKEHKVTVPPEAERTDEKAAAGVKTEEKKEPSQQSMQELPKRSTPILGPEIPKIEQKQAQPIQISENGKQLQKVGEPLSPSAGVVPQFVEPIQSPSSPLPVPLNQFEKPMQPVLPPLVVPIQQRQLSPTVQQSQPVERIEKQEQPQPVLIASVVPTKQL